ncbi:MAG: hypothetical protein HYY37_02470 [Candidatus Aenigmarchaeota archaeon]|nr:hypothetical protein [Candidatus Aenigmarchaeota archaeon]
MAASSTANVEKRILALLNEQLMSTSAIAKKLDMRRELVAGYMEALRHQGKVKMTKVGHSNVFSPAKMRGR